MKVMQNSVFGVGVVARTSVESVLPGKSNPLTPPSIAPADSLFLFGAVLVCLPEIRDLFVNDQDRFGIGFGTRFG